MAIPNTIEAVPDHSKIASAAGLEPVTNSDAHTEGEASQGCHCAFFQ